MLATGSEGEVWKGRVQESHACSCMRGGRRPETPPCPSQARLQTMPAQLQSKGPQASVVVAASLYGLNARSPF